MKLNRFVIDRIAKASIEFKRFQFDRSLPDVRVGGCKYFRFLPIAISIAISLNSQPILANSSSSYIFKEIQKTGRLRVGLRQDAPPIGYRNAQGVLTGYCVDAIAALKQQLQEKLNLSYEILVDIYTSTRTSRFELVADGTVHLECGPNNIDENVEEVAFSDPFLISGTHFLINTQTRGNLDYEGDLEEDIVGVLRETTTETVIAQRYPQTNLQYFRGPTGAFRGIEALEDRIDAFASDGILLIGEVVTRGLPLANYRLVPLVPLSCESYGMILPEGDGVWAGFVNSVLASPEADLIWQDWFEVKFPYIRLDEEVCGD
ncbi:MAG: transporter substrate-binding domain-containing protein [Cyanobacteriota bacterium]|nr:transporter substrate-binding domain-containing protein [Cyanobacteriota bacterium]